MSINSRCFRLLADFIADSDTHLEPALSEKEVRDLFSRHGFAAPKDAVELYTTFGGMPAGHHNGYMFEFWCVEKIDKENNDKWVYLWIADWMIASHFYAIKPVSDKHSEVYIDYKCNRHHVSELICDSLYEFADKIVNDPAAVGIIL